MNQIRIINADVMEGLGQLGDESVHCVVTSPPYWGLRDYGVAGQIGLEPTVKEYVERLVAVFAEVRRVLRKDGTLWLNMGDCYTDSGRGSDIGSTLTGTRRNQAECRKVRVRELHNQTGMKRKDLIGLPWRLAFALQADGWWLRSDIVWHKPNPMPESATDRPTRAHEYVFLMAKSERYWYDGASIRTQFSPKTKQASFETMDFGRRISYGAGAPASHRPKPNGAPRRDKQRGHGRRHAGFNDRWDAMSHDEQRAMGANARTVWSIAPQAFLGAHFATFPEALAEPCIKAGCPDGGMVLDVFGGSGTTALVAAKLGRNAILIELSPKSVEIARDRIDNAVPLLANVEISAPVK